MTAKRRIAVFVVVLAAAFGTGAAAGALLGPIDVGPNHGVDHPHQGDANPDD